MKKERFWGEDLESLRRELAAWRRERVGRCRLPASLWAAAGRVARREGVSRVSRALGIGYQRLRRVAGAEAVAAGPPVQFVEFQAASTQTAEGYRIVLEAGSGRRLRVELGRDLEALERLVGGLWRGTP